MFARQQQHVAFLPDGKFVEEEIRKRNVLRGKYLVISICCRKPELCFFYSLNFPDLEFFFTELFRKLIRYNAVDEPEALFFLCDNFDAIRKDESEEIGVILLSTALLKILKG
nr:hypothetical protein [Chryseobacterium shandongense]